MPEPAILDMSEAPPAQPVQPAQPLAAQEPPRSGESYSAAKYRVAKG